MKTLGAIFAMAVTSLLNGFVFWKLWEWFVTPIGAPQLGYWHAWGLGLFGTWLAVVGHQTTVAQAREQQAELGVLLFAKTMTMLIILGTGYLAHRFGMTT